MIVRYPYLGATLDYISGSDALECVDYFIQQQRSARIYFLNAHCYNLASTDKAYRAALHAADLVMPDGVGVLWGARQLGLPHRENLNGSDFIPRLCQFMTHRHGQFRVFILGGKPGVAEKAGERLVQDYPGVKIVGTQHGYFDRANQSQIVAKINQAAPDIVLVGMGVPLQELWIHRNAPDLKTGAVFAVGGLLDFLAGEVRRAPVAVRQAGFEWAWRMLMEPTRLWKRYVVGNPLFISRIMAGRWSGLRIEEPRVLPEAPRLDYFQFETAPAYATALDVREEAC